MSMNLNTKEVELWQTPTWVTNICYSNNDGGWQGILYRYTEWVKSKLNYPMKTEEYNSVKESVDLHLATIKAAVKKNKKLTFYIQ